MSNDKLKMLQELLSNEELEKKVDAMAKELETLKGQSPIQVIVDGVEKKVVEGYTHPQFETVLKLVSADVNVMLVGESGSGKTVTAQKVAEALELDFYPISLSPDTTEGKLLGFVDANGKVVSPQVVEAYTKGGLLLLDEGDSCRAGAMVTINAILSNSTVGTPKGTVNRHPDFRVIFCANTYGRGATSTYCGRNKLDSATLDRFAVVTYNIDTDFELQLAGNTEFTHRVQYYRRKIQELGIQHVVGMRASINGNKVSKLFTVSELEEMFIFKGLESGIVKKIKRGITDYLKSVQCTEQPVEVEVVETTTNDNKVEPMPQVVESGGGAELGEWISVVDSCIPKELDISSEVEVWYLNGDVDKKIDALMVDWSSVDKCRVAK